MFNFFFLELSVSIFCFMCLISRALLTCFVLRFLFVLPSSIDVSFYLVHVVIILPLLLPRHSFIFLACVFDVMFG